MNQIKVGFCVAYDWPLLEIALGRVYPLADKIILALDRNHISWSGNHFEFDEPAFLRLISTFDHRQKIEVYCDQFYLPDLTPWENEIRQRQMLGHRMGAGGWHIQLDVDEYFIDFGSFVTALRRIGKTRFDICVPLVQLFKALPTGYLLVDPVTQDNIEWIQVATREPAYRYGRRGDKFCIKLACPIVHQSWARTPEEIRLKINNWGHSLDFDRGTFFDFWSQVNENSYKTARSFHPRSPGVWPKLSFYEGTSIGQLLDKDHIGKFLPLNRFRLFFENSIWLSRLAKVWCNVKKMVDKWMTSFRLR